MMEKHGIQNHLTFTGKERDEETGYGYFGARYMDHELTTMWLSVDPMADKYPSISPYAYCAWNPVKLVDPDGQEYGDYFVARVFGWALMELMTANCIDKLISPILILAYGMITLKLGLHIHMLGPMNM